MIGPRTGIGRAAALAQAALLVLTQLVVGSGIHRCPAHDAVVPVAVESHGHAAGHHDGPPAEGESHGFCNCLGASCGSVAQFEAVPANRPALPLARWSTPSTTVERLTPGRPAHLLPFALGPPLHA